MPPLPLRRTWLRKPSGPLPAERRASLSSDTTPAEEAEAEEGVPLPPCCPAVSLSLSLSLSLPLSLHEGVPAKVGAEQDMPATETVRPP